MQINAEDSISTFKEPSKLISYDSKKPTNKYERNIYALKSNLEAALFLKKIKVCFEEKHKYHYNVTIIRMVGTSEKQKIIISMILTKN